MNSKLTPRSLSDNTQRVISNNTLYNKVHEHPVNTAYIAPNQEQVKLLIDGKTSFDCILRNLSTAKKSATIKMYLWRGDNIGQKLAKAILSAADRGVHFKIEKDRHSAIFEHLEFCQQSLFNPQLNFAESLRLSFFAKMTATKIAIKRKHTQINQALLEQIQAHPNIQLEANYKYNDHSKYLKFDKDVLLVGDTNVGDEYHQDWHTYMVEISDKSLLRHFELRLAGKIPFNVNKSVDFAFNHAGRFEIKDIMLEQITQAKDLLTLEMSYFGDKDITRAIIASSARIKQINVIMPACANVQDDLNKRVACKIWDATAGKANIYLYPKMLHTKLIHTDGKRTGIGSANINPTTTRLGETNVYINHETDSFTPSIVKQLQLDILQCSKINSIGDIKHNTMKACIAYFLIAHQRKNTSHARSFIKPYRIFKNRKAVKNIE